MCRQTGRRTVTPARPARPANSAAPCCGALHDSPNGRRPPARGRGRPLPPPSRQAGTGLEGLERLPASLTLKPWTLRPKPLKTPPSRTSRKTSGRSSSRCRRCRRISSSPCCWLRHGGGGAGGADDGTARVRQGGRAGDPAVQASMQDAPAPCPQAPYIPHAWSRRPPPSPASGSCQPNRRMPPPPLRRPPPRHQLPPTPAPLHPARLGLHHSLVGWAVGVAALAHLPGPRDLRPAGRGAAHHHGGNAAS